MASHGEWTRLQFKYQAADPAMTIQVLEAVVPASAREFIAKELFGKMGITNFNWETDVSGLPKSAAGSGVRSRDMLKWGLLILAKGKWQGGGASGCRPSACWPKPCK